MFCFCASYVLCYNGQGLYGSVFNSPYSFVVPHIGNKKLFVHIQQVTKFKAYSSKLTWKILLLQIRIDKTISQIVEKLYISLPCSWTV
jgi:hypothetical protein